MAGGASVAAMIQSLRNNRNLVKDKHKAFDRKGRNARWLHKKLTYKTVSETQTHQFLEKFKAEKQREQRIRTFIWIVAILLIFVALYFVSA